MERFEANQERVYNMRCCFSCRFWYFGFAHDARNLFDLRLYVWVPDFSLLLSTPLAAFWGHTGLTWGDLRSDECMIRVTSRLFGRWASYGSMWKWVKRGREPSKNSFHSIYLPRLVWRGTCSSFLEAEESGIGTCENHLFLREELCPRALSQKVVVIISILFGLFGIDHLYA